MAQTKWAHAAIPSMQTMQVSGNIMPLQSQPSSVPASVAPPSFCVEVLPPESEVFPPPDEVDMPLPHPTAVANTVATQSILIVMGCPPAFRPCT